MQLKVLLLLILIFTASNVYPKESVSIHAEKSVLIHNGFGTGADFLKMGEMQRYTYVLGAVRVKLKAAQHDTTMTFRWKWNSR
jgi:hypothetical protein